MDYLNKLNQKINNKISKDLIIDRVFTKLKIHINQEHQLNILENKLYTLMYDSSRFNIERCNKVLLSITSIKQQLNNK